MRRVAAALLGLLLAAPVWAQKARAPESAEQRADYAALMRAYVDTFRILGRAKACRVDFDAEPYLREVALRHGQGSEPVKVANLGFEAGAENRRLAADLEPVLPAPMPCDVIGYMRSMRLPELPASLRVD